MRLWSAAAAAGVEAVDALLAAIVALCVWSVAVTSSLRALPSRRRLDLWGRARRLRRERLLDLTLRQAAHRSLASAPATLTASVRLTLASASIAPATGPAPVRPSIAEWIALGWSLTLTSVRRIQQTEERRWTALRGGVVALAVVTGGLWLARDPGAALSGLGSASALLSSGLTLSHLLSAAASAIMGSSVLALPAVLLYVALAALWVRLVRHPVEA